MTADDYLVHARHVALVARSIEAPEDRRSMLDYARRLRMRARAVETQPRSEEAKSWSR